MAITSSAKKAYRASLHKHIYNIRRNKAMLAALKNIKKALAIGNVSAAEKLIPQAYKAIDKASKRGIIKANTAARKKSRLISAIRRIGEKNTKNKTEETAKK